MERRLPCEHDSNCNENVASGEISATDEVESNSVESNKNNQSNTQHMNCSKTSELKVEARNKPTEVDDVEGSNRETKEEAEKEQSTKSLPKQRIPLKRHPSSTTGEMKVLPKVNCTEKIIFCLDHSSAMFSTRFKRTLQSIKQTYIFSVLTGAMKQFILTKSFIDKTHEFSLFMLNEDAQLITDFNQQGNEVLFMLQDTVNNSQLTLEDSDLSKDDGFDLSSLFELIERNVVLPLATSSSIMPPYIVRVILVYGRSKGTLSFKKSKESYNKLMQNPYFFVDCIYIHEEPEEANDVTDVFSGMCELDANGTSHILEVSVDGSMSALYNAFAKLVAHPLQRRKQTGGSNLDIAAVFE